MNDAIRNNIQTLDSQLVILSDKIDTIAASLSGLINTNCDHYASNLKEISTSIRKGSAAPVNAELNIIVSSFSKFQEQQRQALNHYNAALKTAASGQFGSIAVNSRQLRDMSEQLDQLSKETQTLRARAKDLLKDLTAANRKNKSNPEFLDLKERLAYTSKFGREADSLNDIAAKLLAAATEFEISDQAIQKETQEYQEIFSKFPDPPNYSEIKDKMTILSAPESRTPTSEHILGISENNITYNWDTILEALNSPPEKLPDATAAEIAMLFLGMDEGNLNKFFAISFENKYKTEDPEDDLKKSENPDTIDLAEKPKELKTTWCPKASLEKIVAFAQATIALSTEAALQVALVPSEEYAPRFGFSSAYTGKKAEDLRKNILTEIDRRNRSQILRLSVLNYVSTISFGSYSNIPLDAPFPSILLYISLDPGDSSYSISYKDTSCVNTALGVVPIPDTAENVAIAGSGIFVSGDFNHIPRDCLSGDAFDGIKEFVRTQLVERTITSVMNSIPEGSGQPVETVPLLGLGLDPLRKIAHAEQDSKLSDNAAGGVMRVSSLAGFVRMMNLNMEAVVRENNSTLPPKTGRGRVYTGAFTVDAVRFMNEAVTAADSQSQKARYFQQQAFGGSITPEDVCVNQDNIIALYNMLPEKVRKQIDDYTGGHNELFTT
jgi:uncharacterized protein YoxC